MTNHHRSQRMSSHGRGRGLRRNFEGGAEKPGGLKVRGDKRYSPELATPSQEDQVQDHPVKRPDSPLPDTFSLPDLLELVDRTELEKLEGGEEARRITRGLRQLASSDDNLRSVIEELHRKSLESEEFGRKAARAFGSVSQLEVAGVKLRDVVLRNIQTDFKRKEEILSSDETQFLNCVSLLCEVFEHLRLADGTVINVLAVPILEYCDLLLTSQSHQAIDLLGRQLQIIGEEVQRSKPEKFAAFMLKVRGMLASDSMAPLSRCALLHLLELHLTRWPVMRAGDKVGEWYTERLGDRVMARRSHGGAAGNYAAARTNGHSRTKEEGLTAEDELVLQRVLGGGAQAPVSPYYDGGVARPGLSHQAQYSTPPPNMLPSPGQPSPAPQFSVQPPPGRFGPPSDHRSRGQRPAHGKVDMNGVERLAVDMMSMGLPPQVSPSGVPGRQPGGWHAMPPNVAPLSGQGPGPRIPTAIVPPGVPPHIRPPSGGQWSSEQDRQEAIPRSNPGSNGGQGGWNAMPPQSGGVGGGRPGGSGRIMPGNAGPQDSSNWNAPRSGPGSLNGSQRGDRSGRPDGDVFDIGTWENPGGDNASGGGGGGGWERGGGRGSQGSGGWDRDREQSGNTGQHWSRGEGMGSSNESQWSTNDGSDTKWSSNDPRRSSNDIKWSSNDVTQSDKKWTNDPRRSSNEAKWSTQPQESQWSSNDGSDNKWSSNDPKRSCNETKWSTNESQWSTNESQWSSNDGNDNKWSTNDGSGPTAWSTNDSRDEASFGTWENPTSRPSLKPIRNEEVRSGAGGWGDPSQATPTKTDWANNSAGSETSPGSAWKKETSVVGNWADDLQSPREKEENPLDASLKEARRSLSNW